MSLWNEERLLKMNVSPISLSTNSTNFKGLFTKPVTIHENEQNIMRNVEECNYYRFSNESKEDAKIAVEKATDIIDFIVDGESELRFEQGKRAYLRGKLPFSTGEWLQYASFNEKLPVKTQILIEEILKRYNLDHYIRKAKV